MTNKDIPIDSPIGDWFREVGTGLTEEQYERGIRLLFATAEEGELAPGVLLTAALADAGARVFEVNVANGWFEEDRTVGDDIALLHSEASEMLEAYREHGLDDMTSEIIHIDRSNPDDTRIFPPKPEGFGSEAADVLIRLLDTCTRRGVNLGWEFRRKLAYNATRGHRHGGKRL